MDDKLCRFLIVNEDSIKESELFTDCHELKNANLINLYQEVKSEHAGVLFFLHYAEDLLQKECEKLPARIEKAERELDRIGNDHVDSIVKIGHKNNVSDEFLKMVVKMYATYEMEACSQVEFSIWEGLFNSIDKTRPSLKDDLKVLLEQYKIVYKYEEAIDYDRELQNKVNVAIKQIKSLHKNYIKTLGFDDRYIKKQHKEVIKEISDKIRIMFNLLCASGNDISALTIINELSNNEFKKNIEGFVRADILSNFRLHGDHKYLDSLIKYIDDNEYFNKLLKKMKDENKDEKDIKVMPLVLDTYEKMKKDESRLLIKYKKLIRNMMSENLNLSDELDLESELIKVNRIIKSFYEEREIEKNTNQEMEEEEKIEKDYRYADFDFEKEMESVWSNTHIDNDDNKPRKEMVLRKLTEEEIKAYFEQLRKLQINKVKKIVDEIVMMKKQVDFVSEYYLKKQDIKYKELLEIFKNLDSNVGSVYESYVSKRLEMIVSNTDIKLNANYSQLQKEFDTDYIGIVNDYDLYLGKEPQKNEKAPTLSVKKIKKMQPLEPLEQKDGIYKALFSAEPNGVDLDERIDRKNRFYVCDFNPEIGIMTFPYANIPSGVQSSKYGRAAIIYDMSIHDKIVSENRGATWASDPDERSRKEINGKETKVYTGNRLVINNKSHNLLQVIAKALKIEETSEQELENKSLICLISHKFDYRKENVALRSSTISKTHDRNDYHSVSEVPWISNDDINISDYKAVCYMDSAEKLKIFIESL